MDRTHDTYVKDLLRDVWDLGAAQVEMRLLYRWYGASRLTKRIWNDLMKKWAEVAEESDDEEGWRLGVVNNGRPDILTLICLDPKKAGESYLQPLNVWAGQGDDEG